MCVNDASLCKDIVLMSFSLTEMDTLVPGDKIIIDITKMPNPPSSKPLSGWDFTVLKIEGTECMLDLNKLCVVEKAKPFSSDEGLVVKEPYPVSINTPTDQTKSGFDILTQKNIIAFKG